jgi:hypothetical protein
MLEPPYFDRRRFLGAAALAAAGLQFGMAPSTEARPSSALRSLDVATTWLNSRPLRAEGLVGKVALIDFWTYTCINWRSCPNKHGRGTESNNCR